MAVFRKRDVEKVLADLDQYYKALREAIAGDEYSEDEAARYMGAERYDVEGKPKLVLASIDKMEDAVEHLKASFPAIKRLKTKTIKLS